LIDLLDIDAVFSKPNYRNIKIGQTTFRDEWGITRTTTGFEEYAIALDQYAPIKSWADLEKWEPPDPNVDLRFTSIKSCVERFKGKRAIFIIARDVWSYPRDLMGYENLMVACLQKPDLVEGVIQKCMGHTLHILERAAELGVEFVVTGDDIADNRSTLISPKLWVRLFLPHFCQFVQSVHNLGLYFWKHTDGQIMAVLDGLVEAGIDGIDPIDPLAGMDLEKVKQLYGSRIAIKGNVNCAGVLVSGTEEAVIQEVIECISKAGKNGGYVCSSSNSIHKGVKPELYKAMVDAIHRYGVYE
jgi:uroporphyrinogen decarboxylase